MAMTDGVRDWGLGQLPHCSTVQSSPISKMLNLSETCTTPTVQILIFGTKRPAFQINELYLQIVWATVQRYMLQHLLLSGFEMVVASYSHDFHLLLQLKLLLLMMLIVAVLYLYSAFTCVQAVLLVVNILGVFLFEELYRIMHHIYPA